MQEALEKLIVLIVAIVVCIIVEAMKKAGLGKSKDANKSYYELISIALGILINILLNLNNITAMVIVQGLVSGWASNGLYDLISKYWPPKAITTTDTTVK